MSAASIKRGEIWCNSYNQRKYMLPRLRRLHLRCKESISVRRSYTMIQILAFSQCTMGRAACVVSTLAADLPRRLTRTRRFRMAQEASDTRQTRLPHKRVCVQLESADSAFRRSSTNEHQWPYKPRSHSSMFVQIRKLMRIQRREQRECARVLETLRGLRPESGHNGHFATPPPSHSYSLFAFSPFLPLHSVRNKGSWFNLPSTVLEIRMTLEIGEFVTFCSGVASPSWTALVGLGEDVTSVCWPTDLPPQERAF